MKSYSSVVKFAYDHLEDGRHATAVFFFFFARDHSLQRNAISKTKELSRILKAVIYILLSKH